MRTLLVAAIVALSVSAAHAQAPAQDRTLSTAPSATLIDQLKAAGELKDPKALEAPAPRLESVDRAADTQPAVAQPPETPASAPAAVVSIPAPAASAAVPATPAAVATTTAATPAEAKPVQAATEAKPAKKRVARKPETAERKARRIAAKYGVYW